MNMNKSRNSIRLFFSVVLLSLLVKLFILDLIFVSGPSMMPTLHNGSFVLEFRLAWGIPVPFSNRYFLRWGKPEQGEIVIFPWLGRNVIKRCVATEGTPLSYSHENGYWLKIGDRIAPLTEEQYHRLEYTSQVPEGMIFAMGDNLPESRDSREYGFVSLDSIRGLALWK
jgi:signal peptidase I